jgi:hypothetical protein
MIIRYHLDPLELFKLFIHRIVLKRLRLNGMGSKKTKTCRG